MNQRSRNQTALVDMYERSAIPGLGWFARVLEQNGKKQKTNSLVISVTSSVGLVSASKFGCCHATTSPYQSQGQHAGVFLVYLS